MTQRSWQHQIDSEIDTVAERLASIRRHLHAHPEPSGEEFETTRYLAEILSAEGLLVRVAPSGRGVVAEPELARDQRRIAVRADIDALRMQDEKRVPYRSTRGGVTHACGHDGHTSIVLGVAFALHRCKDRLPWQVPWRVVFQPAEETSMGAQEMVAAGATDNVAAIVALHVDPERRVGRVGCRRGTMTAYCVEIDVVVSGDGGHAARPHHSVDPILAACQFTSAVYQFVPRSVDSRDPVVATFGMIHGGSSQNVIPNEVRMRGTARTHSLVARSRVEERIEEIARGIAAASGTEIAVSFKRGPDAVVNDPRVTECCVTAATELLGADAVETIEEPSMGGEDFADYLAHAPGCLLRLGVSTDPATAAFLHSPRFDIDENALAIGAKLLARSAVLLARTHR